MKLIKIRDNQGSTIFINPNNILWCQTHTNDYETFRIRFSSDNNFLDITGISEDGIREIIKSLDEIEL